MNTNNSLLTNTLDWEHNLCSVSNASANRECAICDAPSNGYHFNAPSCSACAAFFRRTVTLRRNFVCTQQGQCQVNYALRVICRACRYIKCLEMGMDRCAVQPRRDCNSGRRKIMYQQDEKPPRVVIPTASHTTPYQQISHNPAQPVAAPVHNQMQIVQPVDFVFQESNVFAQLAPNDTPPLMQDQNSPEAHYPHSYSSSISEDVAPSPKLSLASSFTSKDFAAEQVLDDLLREERLFNERRKLLYCSKSSITQLLTSENVNDIPYTATDMIPLTFYGIQKHIRPQILVIYEWLRGWRHFEMLNPHDRNIFLRRSVLYHTVLDPSYLTYRLGLPHRYVMFNAMYVGVDEDDTTGWEDEDNCISADLKKKLYRPLMQRTIKEICGAMQASNMTFVEFVFLKTLVIFKSSSCSDISVPLKRFMNSHMNLILKALNLHYQNIGLSREEIAQRTGNLVLMMSGIFAVGMECLESHQQIQFFDLWQLDDLLIKLISRGGGA